MGIFGIVPPANSNNVGGGFGRFETKRPYNFVAEFTAESSGSALSTTLSRRGVSDSLKFTLRSISMPELMISEVAIQHGNERFKYAGRSNLANDNVQAVFYDVFPGSARASGDTEGSLISPSAIFYEWQQIIQDFSTGRSNVAREYKGQIVISLLTPDTGNIVEKWIYVGAWPKQITGAELDMTSEEPRVFTVQFSVDKMFRVAPSASAPPTEEVDFSNAAAGGVEADAEVGSQ